MKKLFFALAVITAASFATPSLAQNKATKGTKGGVALDSAHHSTNNRRMNARTAPAQSNAAHSGNTASPNTSPKKIR